ncbi:MAG: hypothetical protein ACI88A_003095 [Paraglaciecola sp.]|jgi:hypothetical protein
MHTAHAAILKTSTAKHQTHLLKAIQRYICKAKKSNLQS